MRWPSEKDPRTHVNAVNKLLDRVDHVDWEKRKDETMYQEIAKILFANEKL